MSENSRTSEKTALKRAALLTVAAAGGVSALLFSFGGAATSADGSGQSTVVTEYVDVNGNPVDPTALAGGQTPVVYIDENGVPYDDSQALVAASTAPSAGPSPAAYEYEEYEDDGHEEYEDDDLEEYEEDHDDHDEYEDEEYEDDEYEEYEDEEGEQDD